MRRWMLAASPCLVLLALPALAGDGPAPRPAQDAPAQAPESRPAQTQPTDRQPITARVIEVVGDVQHAPIGARDWQPCSVDDVYPEQTKIRTGVRSSVKLMIGEEEPYTVVMIEAVGLTVLSEAWRSPDTKRVRLGVGYGKVRAGVAEGGLQSQFTIDSPVATLSKRGTWNFGLYFERGTGRFEVFLLDRGLVDALNVIRGVTRRVLPREHVTQAMRRWLDEAQIQRNVPVSDLLGHSDVELAFNRLRQDGLGVMDPGSGNRPLINLSTRFAQSEFRSTLRDSLPYAPVDLGTGGPPQPVPRPEGFFGTGRGDQLIPVLIDPDSALARRGYAVPGRYLIRRSAIESWLRSTEPRR